MPSARHLSPRDAGGFTLPELLTVMLIIGLLAAIALPNFLGQQDRGRDAVTKSSAVNLSRMVETCTTSFERPDYRDCDTQAELADGGAAGLPWGLGVGEVLVTGATATTYEIRARSLSGAEYTLARDAAGTIQRTCSPPASGGCSGEGTW